MQPDLLLRLEQAAVAAFGDEQLNLLGRMHVPVPGVLHAHQLEEQVAAAVQEVDRPRERMLGPLHRNDRPHRGLCRVLQCDGLRHELAHNHRQRRQDQQDDDGRRGLGGFGFQSSDPLDEGREAWRDRRLGVGSENQAAERDADLRGGDVAVERMRVFEDGQNPGRQAIAVLGQPSQPAPARAHDGELRRHEQRRQQDQQGDDP